IGAGLEIGIAKAAIAALEQHNALAHFGKVGNQRFLVFFEDLGADRDAQHRVLAIATGAIAAHAVNAHFGAEMLLVAIVDERIEPIDTFGHHITAAAAIAAIGSTKFD